VIIPERSLSSALLAAHLLYRCIEDAEERNVPYYAHGSNLNTNFTENAWLDRFSISLRAEIRILEWHIGERRWGMGLAKWDSHGVKCLDTYDLLT